MLHIKTIPGAICWHDVCRITSTVQKSPISLNDDFDFGHGLLAQLVIAKNRHGPTRTIHLYFDGKFSRFQTLATEFSGAPAAV